MTTARALTIRLIGLYRVLGYPLTLKEMQKLSYFLQEAGEPLGLRYEAGLYGPYAHNLNHVLESLEGHFIRGYGDAHRPDEDIELLPDALTTAERFLAGNEEAKQRLGRVAELIEGFEDPYGMELLASLHWVAVHGQPRAVDAEAAVASVHNWNDRKRALLGEEHLRIAWDRLREHGWLDGADESRA